MTDILPLILLTPTLLVLVLGLVWFVVRYQRIQMRQQQELAQLQDAAQQQALAAALVAQEDERQRIAGELHDGVGTILALAKLHLYAPGSTASPEASALIDQAVAEVRRISRNLQPATLQQLGLTQALRALIQAVPIDVGPEVRLEQEGSLGRLIPPHELMVYRIAQELLTNGLVHAAAPHIVLRVSAVPGLLTLTYSDDGQGFDLAALEELPPPGPHGQPVGMGLINLRSRVAVLGGQLHYHSEPGVGTRVEAILPVTLLPSGTPNPTFSLNS
ncbi:sensor histidine kinase [Hymenobacter terrenus]|uniref:sensor histidine kinase n=1 Tax=Hymenobacter terrenus TaxID=1629124 RepID=UPI0006198977|nr:sensor histidine kinase [Hymenobacter terrenus]